jgi:hypothetical protein
MRNGNNIAKKTVRLSITFMDGREIGYAWEAADEDLFRASSSIDRVLHNQAITLSIEGRLIIIPLSSVRYVEINPVPINLPGHVVKGAWPI